MGYGKESMKKLHLGCGTNYIKEWINIDRDSKIADKRADLTKGLPYSGNTVSYIYSEHFIEHLYYEEFRRLLFECYRVLVPGGVIRISTPDLKFVVDCYITNNLEGCKEHAWCPETACRMINDCFSRWGHKYVYDKEELALCLRGAGFSDIKLCKWKQSDHAEFFNIESRCYHHDLVMEGTKR